MKKTWTSGHLAALAGVIALAVLAVGLPGCSSPVADSKGGTAGTQPPPPPPEPVKGEMKVGFIYVGPKDDYGYNQAHAQGAAAVKKLPEVKVQELEKVPEGDEVQQVIGNLIDVEGAKVVFATSYGYFNPHVIEVAKKYPDVWFGHCGGPWKKGEHPNNIFSYFGYIDECQYLSGIVAGHMTKSNKLGFIAAKPIPQVRRNINAFLLGARSVNPKAEVHVVFTGDWSEPTKEADGTKLLIDKGCDVFTCHVDSPKVVAETAAKAGKFVCGYHASQADLCGDLYLTGAEWNWAKVYTDYVSKIKKGEKIENYLRGGLKAGIVKTSPYGPKVSDKAKKDADAAKAKLTEGTFVIFKGPLKSNTGKEVIAQGTALQQDDPILEGMDYLVEGVVGAD